MQCFTQKQLTLRKFCAFERLFACSQVVHYLPNRGLEHDFFWQIMPVFVMLMALEHDFHIISNTYHWLECSQRMRNSLNGLRKSCLVV